MNFNTDGFNDRTNYIHNANDINRLKKMNSSNIDNSFAKMKMEENRPDIKTVNKDKEFSKENIRGNKDNFILRNNNMMNVNKKVNSNNPVSRAMDKNRFKNF
jgi:hypothetical protein